MVRIAGFGDEFQEGEVVAVGLGAAKLKIRVDDAAADLKMRIIED